MHLCVSEAATISRFTDKLFGYFERRNLIKPIFKPRAKLLPLSSSPLFLELKLEKSIQLRGRRNRIVSFSSRSLLPSSIFVFPWVFRACKSKKGERQRRKKWKWWHGLVNSSHDFRAADCPSTRREKPWIKRGADIFIFVFLLHFLPPPQKIGEKFRTEFKFNKLACYCRVCRVSVRYRDFHYPWNWFTIIWGYTHALPTGSLLIGYFPVNFSNESILCPCGCQCLNEPVNSVSKGLPWSRNKGEDKQNIQQRDSQRCEKS